MTNSETTVRYNTAYHPQMDGQSEVVNMCLKQYLRALGRQQPQYLGWAELYYNLCLHSSTGMT